MTACAPLELPSHAKALKGLVEALKTAGFSAGQVRKAAGTFPQLLRHNPQMLAMHAHQNAAALALDQKTFARLASRCPALLSQDAATLEQKALAAAAILHLSLPAYLKVASRTPAIYLAHHHPPFLTYSPEKIDRNANYIRERLELSPKNFLNMVRHNTSILFRRSSSLDHFIRDFTKAFALPDQTVIKLLQRNTRLCTGKVATLNARAKRKGQ